MVVEQSCNEVGSAKRYCALTLCLFGKILGFPSAALFGRHIYLPMDVQTLVRLLLAWIRVN